MYRISCLNEIYLSTERYEAFLCVLNCGRRTPLSNGLGLFDARRDEVCQTGRIGSYVRRRCR